MEKLFVELSAGNLFVSGVLNAIIVSDTYNCPIAKEDDLANDGKQHMFNMDENSKSNKLEIYLLMN